MGFVAVEGRSIGGEIVIRCCLGAEDTITHLNHIQIHFHDALLAPKELYQDREIGFHSLAKISARVECEDVLSRLLRDCTATTRDAAVALVLLISIGDGVPIKATVVVELGVLVIDDCGDEVGGRCPPMASTGAVCPVGVPPDAPRYDA